MKKRLLSLLLACVMAFSLAVPAAAAKNMNFSDVKTNDWFYGNLKDL